MTNTAVVPHHLLSSTTGSALTMLIYDLCEAAPLSSLLVSSSGALVVLGEENKHIVLGDVRVSQPLLKIKSHNKTMACKAVRVHVCAHGGGVTICVYHSGLRWRSIIASNAC